MVKFHVNFVKQNEDTGGSIFANRLFASTVLADVLAQIFCNAMEQMSLTELCGKVCVVTVSTRRLRRKIAAKLKT